jgi:hypothetical protein
MIILRKEEAAMAAPIRKDKNYSLTFAPNTIA